MDGALRVITGPTQEPISLAEAKAQLRVDHTSEDDLIQALIETARVHAEDYLWRALITQTLELVLDGFPGSVIRLPRPPLQSVTSVTYYDEDGSGAAFASSNYQVAAAGEPGYLILKSGSSWPSVTLQEAEGVVVRFVAGYGDDPRDVPLPIRQGMLMLIGHLYENRESVVIDRGISVMEVPYAIHALWYPYRFWSF